MKIFNISIIVPLSGLAAITTNNVPMNKFVEDNYNGFLIDVEKYLGRPDGYYWAESICNIDSLATKIQEYIIQPSILIEHKNNARIFATKYFDWKKNAKQLQIIFSIKYNKSKTQPTLRQIKMLKSLDNKMSLTNIFKLKNTLYFLSKDVIHKTMPQLFKLLKKQ